MFSNLFCVFCIFLFFCILFDFLICFICLFCMILRFVVCFLNCLFCVFLIFFGFVHVITWKRAGQKTIAGHFREASGANDNGGALSGSKRSFFE